MIGIDTIVYAVVFLLVGGLILGLLRDVRPSFSVDDLADNGVADAEFIGELLLSDTAFRITGTNGDNLRFGQFCGTVNLPMTHLLFRRRVSHVVGMGAEEVVRRIDAERVITAGAVVANLKTVGDGAVGKFPRHAVREQNAPAEAGPVDDAVAAIVDAARPENAPGYGRLTHPLVQVILERDGLRGVVTLLRTEVRGSGFELRRRARESLPAVAADAFDTRGILTGHADLPFKVRCVTGRAAGRQRRPNIVA